jgi:hypothetical protein
MTGFTAVIVWILANRMFIMLAALAASIGTLYFRTRSVRWTRRALKAEVALWAISAALDFTVGLLTHSALSFVFAALMGWFAWRAWKNLKVIG